MALIAAVVLASVIVLLSRPHTESTPSATTPPSSPATSQATTNPGTYFIGGGVPRPGAYSLDKPVTLRELITAAGIVGASQVEGTVITVRDGGEQGTIIRTDLGPLMRDSVGDMSLRPNDKVMVKIEKPTTR